MLSLEPFLLAGSTFYEGYLNEFMTLNTDPFIQCFFGFRNGFFNRVLKLKFAFAKYLLISFVTQARPENIRKLILLFWLIG